MWEEKLRVKAGRGLSVGVSETRYELIWMRDILQSPALCLSYCGETNQLFVGHYDGEIQVRRRSRHVTLRMHESAFPVPVDCLFS